MAREDPLYRLRMPLAMKDALHAAAQRNHRSLNAEIVARLEASMGAACGLEDAPGAYHAEPPAAQMAGPLTLNEDQHRALMLLVSAMTGEPMTCGSSYVSPHQADADKDAEDEKREAS